MPYSLAPHTLADWFLPFSIRIFYTLCKRTWPRALLNIAPSCTSIEELPTSKSNSPVEVKNVTRSHCSERSSEKLPFGGWGDLSSQILGLTMVNFLITCHLSMNRKCTHTSPGEGEKVVCGPVGTGWECLFQQDSENPNEKRNREIFHISR